ncbi:hypothetical protein Drorol1_Dr00016830 [Drosera rotundifolia]
MNKASAQIKQKDEMLLPYVIPLFFFRWFSSTKEPSKLAIISTAQGLPFIEMKSNIFYVRTIMQGFSADASWVTIHSAPSLRSNMMLQGAADQIHNVISSCTRQRQVHQRTGC